MSDLENKNELKKGFTTGSCAAAAAKAAAFMLFSGSDRGEISIITPAGIVFDAKLTDIKRTSDTVSCAVIKDGGDDPDVTSGVHVYSAVSILTSEAGEEVKNTKVAGIAVAEAEVAGDEMTDTEMTDATVIIDGGIGVGRVTKPGLDQPVGNAAINHVPREMIEKEVLEVCRLFDFKGKLKVVVSIPEGLELAEKTFNPRLGIVGGISVLGTSGIVEPMSSQAILDTILVELKQKRALGYEYVAVSPGNYGVDFMAETFSYDLDKSVKCSNFIGDTIDMILDLGFKGVLLTGHIGKLIKVSGGVMNTHSKYGDRRMELLCESARECKASEACCRSILTAVTTEEGIRIIKEHYDDDKTAQIMNLIMDKILFHLSERAGKKIEIGCILYSSDYGILSQSENAMEMLECIRKRG